jgi:hypothetical protein
MRLFRLFRLAKGPRNVRLQDLPTWKSDFAASLSSVLAQHLVIELDAADDAAWNEDNYPALFATLRQQAIVSLTFTKARFEYGYKTDDDRYDGIMGWTRAHRTVCVGPALAKCMEEEGLPRTLRELSIRDAGLGTDDLKSVLSAVPRTLEKLDVTGNDVGTAGLCVLATAGFPSLTELRVGWRTNPDGYGVLIDSMSRRPGCILVLHTG